MKNKKGFTLVELVIVIAVIAILAGVLIGTFATVIANANKSKALQEWKALIDEEYINFIADNHVVPSYVIVTTTGAKKIEFKKEAPTEEGTKYYEFKYVEGTQNTAKYIELEKDVAYLVIGTDLSYSVVTTNGANTVAVATIVPTTNPNP